MDINEFDEYIKKTPSVLVYLSTEACSVCKVLKPKIINMLDTSFPKMDFLYIDCEKQKEIAAQNTVFAVPTILVFFEGKENIRKSRSVGIEQLKSEIKRIYELMFD